MDKKTDYFETIRDFIKAHQWSSLGILIVLIILSIRYEGFLKLLQTILSPQIIVCGLIFYFLVRFSAEISRLIDRIREVKGPGVSLKADRIPTPIEKEHLLEPEAKILESTADANFLVSIGDPETKFSIRDVVDMTKPLRDKLSEAFEKATYWFYKYLLRELSSQHLWVLRKIAGSPEGMNIFFNLRFWDNPSTQG